MPRRIFRAHWSILSNLWPLLNVLEMSSLSWLIKKSSLRYHPHIDRMIQLDWDAWACSEQSSSADSIELETDAVRKLRRSTHQLVLDTRKHGEIFWSRRISFNSPLLCFRHIASIENVCSSRSHFICRSLFCSVCSLIKKALEIIIYFIMTFHKKEREREKDTNNPT